MEKFAVATIALALLFAGCVDYNGQNPDGKNASVSAQNASGENLDAKDSGALEIERCVNESSIRKAFCYSDLAIEKDDMGVCFQIGENDSAQRLLDSDYCAAKFALHKKNSSICQRVRTASIRDACYIDLALALDEPRICSGVGDLENRHRNCYMRMAEGANSTRICAMIEDANYSQFCMAKVLGGAEYCAGINGTYVSDLCYLQIAWDKKEWKQCLQIRGDEMLHDTCVAAIAALTQNSSVCANVKLPENVQNCLAEVERGLPPSG
jgi:hypothetical protein